MFWFPYWTWRGLAQPLAAARALSSHHKNSTDESRMVLTLFGPKIIIRKCHSGHKHGTDYPVVVFVNTCTTPRRVPVFFAFISAVRLFLFVDGPLAHLGPLSPDVLPPNSAGWWPWCGGHVQRLLDPSRVPAHGLDHRRRSRPGGWADAPRTQGGPGQHTVLRP